MLAKAKHSVSAYQRETVPFLGLNRSDDTQEGEFSEQKNLSGRRYPYLAPRLPRSVETRSDEPEALFYWDGHEVVAAGGTLYLDGESVINVTSGAKQFAVVNTKLVVWPDGVCVDLTNKEAKTLGAEMVNKGAVSFGTDSLTLTPQGVYSSGSMIYAWDEGGEKVYAWTYSDVSWNATDGWTLTGGAYTAINSTDCVGRYYIPSAAYNSTTNSYTVGAPKVSFGSKTADKTVGNNVGFYCQFTGLTPGSEYYETAYGGRCEQNWDIYWAQQENGALDQVFSVGDVVSVSGSSFSFLNRESIKITGIDAQNNTLHFADGSIPMGGLAYYRAGSAVTESDTQSGLYYRDELGTASYYPVTGTTNGYFTMDAGWYAVQVDSSRMDVYDGDGVFQKSYNTQLSTSGNTGHYRYATRISPTNDKVKVERKIPGLDYICEHENRLWGVSNEDNTIYASALGDPHNFFDYSGEAGGWAVAVGSEGDFTGICSYGNAVLCWKERALHKVLGSYPSSYQTAVYRFAGVRAGAHKSLVNVNETLFFLGADGVYAYTGNKPSLISRVLGDAVLKDGVGGTDGKAYYLSAKNGEAWEILTYDTHTGLWTRSDETHVVDFARNGDKVKFLAGGSIYTIGDGTESVEWEAVFAPMYETLEGGKQYNRLVFRVEVPKDGWLAADVRFDGGRWIQVGIVKGKSGPVHMPVPLRRCDKFQIRLRGKGDCAVLDMVREFRLRGER